jgi:uncharacterized spore protein YtfJ
MDTREILNQAGETMTIKRVVGEPIERDGVTVVPVAMVIGGAGGGGGRSGPGEKQEGEGSGGGYGLVARRGGTYVIKGDTVSWQPAVDVTLIALGGQLVALAAFFTIRVVAKVLAKRRGRVAP